MRQRHKLAIAVLLIGVLSWVFISAWPGEPEPIYQGRTLSVWLQDFGSSDPAERLRAADAVREIGPSAVPFLVRELRPSMGPSWEYKVRLFFVRVPIVGRFFAPSVHRRWEAVAACDALGPAAKGALPELEKLLRANDPTAALAMADIGLAAAPLLVNAATNASSIVRCYARAALGIIEGHSKEAFASESRYDFMRRGVMFNSKVVDEAFVELRAQHPELSLTNSPPDGTQKSNSILTNKQADPAADERKI